MRRSRAVVLSTEDQGSTTFSLTLTSRDANVLSFCFLGSAFTSVSSLESPES